MNKMNIRAISSWVFFVMVFAIPLLVSAFYPKAYIEDVYPNDQTVDIHDKDKYYYWDSYASALNNYDTDQSAGIATSEDGETHKFFFCRRYQDDQERTEIGEGARVLTDVGKYYYDLVHGDSGANGANMVKHLQYAFGEYVDAQHDYTQRNGENVWINAAQNGNEYREYSGTILTDNKSAHRPFNVLTKFIGEYHSHWADLNHGVSYYPDSNIDLSPNWYAAVVNKLQDYLETGSEGRYRIPKASGYNTTHIAMAYHHINSIFFNNYT